MTNESIVELLHPAPSDISNDAFIAAYGGIYEDSPWVAEALCSEISNGDLDAMPALKSAMRDVVENADSAKRLELIRAHPELAGRAAIAGNLTDASTSEQSGAGLDQCSPDEFAAFNSYNAAYNEKFGFPFIIAVTGLDRTAILAAFQRRLSNDRDTELAQAMIEIHKIAEIRLTSMTQPKDEASCKTS